MGSPYVGEIRMFGGSFAPVGWLFCWGQQLSIAEYDTLFNLIGTTYGGDGQENFNLPDLQSRIPVHIGPNFALAQSGGVEQVTLTTNQIPTHTHTLLANDAAGTLPAPNDNVLARSHTPNVFMYLEDVPTVQMAPAIGPVGGSQPHDNIAPYTAINYIISLYGIFPPPT